MIGKARRTHENAKSKSDLQAQWVDVDWLFIDEISMVSCELLSRISVALSEAKGNTEPFGGINIVVAGDFAQLPPVAETKLFARWKPSNASGTQRGQTKTAGHVLWLSFDTIVFLVKQCRQANTEDARFVELLERLRTGSCNNEDYELLNSRLISRLPQEKLAGVDWLRTPVIVPDNATKDVLNEFAVLQFAQATGQDVCILVLCKRLHQGKTN